MKIKNNYFAITSLFILGLTACNKNETSAELNVTKNMISDKTWYLDYSVTNNVTKTYVGQTTYFINFLKNGQSKDSDGIMGYYAIQKPNNILQVYVNASTISGASANYTYNIESIGAQNLILSFTKNGARTQLYYSTK